MIRQDGVPVTYTASATHIRKQRFYRSTEPALESAQNSALIDNNDQSVVTSQLQTTMLANEYQQLVLRRQRDDILRQAEIQRLQHENQMLELRQQAELQRLQHENRMREFQLEIARLKRDIPNSESRRTVAEHRPRNQDRDAYYIPRSQSHEADKLKASYDFKNQKASAEASGNIAWFLGIGLLAFAGVAYSRNK
ncbi:hypothetical protein JWZ98_05965 [Methylomonas sp. EFPC1]|uniref:hypothetical protein n=1 Tax=Methylomonas sp. EFPC1 TaxID=2812647 RepID=UPI0019671100|nr:hypothetical protein [Methylomonas sp. EFPC1]QSB02485.1 hypothetical protein JWZ98_05965 [Methylomonas sp. EFPC1]